MDTEKLLLLNDNAPTFSFDELVANDLIDAKHYVEITRHLQEIHHLFLMFKYSLDNLITQYQLTSSGTILQGEKPANTMTDFIAINTMVNTIISAGKTLIDAMTCYIKENLVTSNPNQKKHLAFCSYVYDNSFAYRFLLRLRDYSQHGHLPVSKCEDWYGFDLYQIKDKPHYHHNAQVKQQIDNAVKEIIDIYKDVPKLSLVMTIAEYIPQLASVYKHFFDCVEDDLTHATAAFTTIVSKYPQNIHKTDECQASLFFYDLEDDMAHATILEENPLPMLSDFRDEAETFWNTYTKLWDDLKSGMLIFRIVDKDCLEISCFD